MGAGSSRRARRRLLLVLHRPLAYEGPAAVRWRFFADHLPEHGWEVTAVSARPNPTADELSPDPRLARLFAARARVTGTLGKALRPAANSLGVQPEAFAPSLVWSVTARRMLTRQVDSLRPDAVVASSPPPAALFATAGALAGRGLPLVAELRDNWAGHPSYDAGGGLLAALEGAALRRFDAVVGVTDGLVARLAALHPELRGRLRLLPNGFPPDLLARRSPGRRGGRLTVIHPGVLYGERSLSGLLEAIGRDGLASRLSLELVGNLDRANRHALDAAPDGLDIVVAGPRPWTETLARMEAADIVLVLVPRSMGDDVAWPVKLFEALALGKPVLAVTSGGATEALLRDLGQDAGCARDGDPASIGAALGRLIDDPPPPVAPDRLARWDRGSVTRAYAELLDDLLAGRA